MEAGKLEKLLKTVDPAEALEHIEDLEALVKDILFVQNLAGQLFTIEEKTPIQLRAWYDERKRVLAKSPLLEQKEKGADIDPKTPIDGLKKE